MNASLRLATLIFCVGFLATNHAFGKTEDTKVKSVSVRARVVSAVGEGVGIHAKKIPGKFTVPEDCIATDFKYHFHDPKSDMILKELSSGNIYSVDKKKYMPVSGDGEGLTLPSGKYKFVVGGGPGAYGSLGFKLIPKSGHNNGNEDIDTSKVDRTIEVVTWLKNFPDSKTKATFQISGTKVTGSINQTYDNVGANNPNVTCEPYRNVGKFTGTITGDVISGTWEIETLPHRWTFTGNDGNRFSRLDSGEMTITSRTILQSGGSVEESIKGSGVVNVHWSDDAPEGIKPRKQTNKYDITVPDKDTPGGFIGTWKDR